MLDTADPMRLRLRPFRLADARAVEPWLSAPGLSLPAGQMRREWPRRLLADARIMACVAWCGRQRIGLVRLDCGPDQVAEVTVVVAPGHRRRGHGRQMIAAVLGEARRLGLRELVAQIDLGNEAALAFFAELGFEPAGRVVGSRLAMTRLVHGSDGAAPLDISA